MVKSMAMPFLGVPLPTPEGEDPKERIKRPAEFWPTPHNVTWALLQYLKPSRNLKVYDPCSGEGDIVLPLKFYGFSEIFASDLREGFEIVGEERIDFLMGGYEPPADILFINPPFSLAAEFIQRAIWKYPAVCVLLKSTYWNAGGRIDLFDEHPPSHVLPVGWRPDFSWKDEVPMDCPVMDVMWCCWGLSGGNTSQVVQPLRKPNDVRADHFLGMDVIGEILDKTTKE